LFVAHSFTSVHVILPPWYDAVVDLPSAKHVNGALDALEKNPASHDSVQVDAACAVPSCCLP